MHPHFPWQFGTILPWLDLFGIAIFAITGALVATRRGDIVTAAFFALVTGVGGGSVRDLLIGAPVFWMHDPYVAIVCLLAAVLVWVTPGRWWQAGSLVWLDAVGLSAYAVFGAAKALAFEIPPVPAALMGVITACVGGIIRDVLAGQPSILLRAELYVTVAGVAAGLYVALVSGGATEGVAAGVAAVAGFALRAVAIRWGIALPYRGER
jgi:uncharacterized membrane protein YeiH